MFAAAAFVGRRCNLFSHGRAFGWYPLSRCLATQITSAAQANINNAMRSIPWVIVSCGTEPKSHYVYNLAASSSDNPKADHLKLDHEIVMKVSVWMENWIVGSSHGYLIFMSTANNIRAINPVTGNSIDIPSVPCNYCDQAKGTKVILSPSRDMAVILPNKKGSTPAYVHLPTYEAVSLIPSSSSICWNILPLARPMDHVTDCIFHKGCLCFCDNNGTVSMFDDHFFDVESDPSASQLLNSYFWHSDEVRGEHGSTMTSILMESYDGNDLYLLLRRITTMSLHLKVFKLDRGFRHWEEVQSIGDSVVFVGKNSAMSFPAHDFPLLQPDSIYFTGHGFGFNWCDKGSYTGVYYLKYHSFEFFSSKDGQILTDLSSIWFENVAS